MCKQLKICILIICQIFIIQISYSQLTASFKLSKNSGCASTIGVITIVNTTTGASSSATYSWDFGNGNTSSLPDTVYATYPTAGTYTVRLTVKDGTYTSAYTDYITVYGDPSVNFTFSTPSVGCVPLAVNFTSNVNANGGTITTYTWDFDDGQTSGLTNPSHTYTSGIRPTVKLVVTNSNQCTGSVSKTGIVAYPYPVPSFTSADTILCSAGSAAAFTNTTSYDTSHFGSLTYLWNFGDGGTSTQTNPSHTYTTKGTFNVQLTATDSAGCSASTLTTGYIRVGNFSTNFATDTLLCTNTIDVITDISGTKASARNWFIDGSFASSDSSFNYQFPSTGYHTVKLMNQYNNCIDTLSKTVLVKTALPIDSFKIVNNNSTCGAPTTVQLIDTATHVNCKRVWLVVPPSGLSNSSTYTTATVNYTANELGTYGATLTIMDTTTGCTNSITDSFMVANPTVTITHDTPSSCIPFTLTFTATVSPSNLSITNLSYWDFGDGSNSYSASPVTHTYSTAGSYQAVLYYTTSNGCTGSATDPDSVRAYNKPQSLFKVSQYEICGNSTLYFTDTSQGNPTQWYWNFGDSSATQKNFYSTLENPSHKYQDSGFYAVTLIAKNPSCFDTMVKKNYVHILPDFPNGVLTENCTNRNTVTLVNASKYNLDSLFWNTGDGSTPIKINPTSTTLVPYSYAATGSYLTQLIGYKAVTPLINPALTNCVVKDTLPVNVLLKQKPVLTLLDSNCNSKGIDFRISGLQHDPAIASGGASYSILKFQFNDGTTYSGSTNFNISSTTFDTTFTGTLINGFGGHDSVCVIIQRTDSLQCQDTSNYIPINAILVADFIPDSAISCKLNPIKFINESTPRKGVSIVKWIWNFGDNSNNDTLTNITKTSDTLVHQYDTTAYYYPQLTVIDSLGCSSSTAILSKVAIVDGPVANFSFSPSTGIIPYTPVAFSNTSLGTLSGSSVSYIWSSKYWGTQTGFNPVTSYIYGNVLPDTVTLIASSIYTTCPNDTITKIIPVQTITVAFTDSMHYSNTTNCPPLQVIFKNATTNAKSFMWSFGDGSFSYDSLPQHIYTVAGNFRVVLYGYGNNGYVDSASDTIHVLGPTGSVTATSIASKCIPATYTFIAQTNAVSYKWIYGDGSESAAVTSASDTVTYTYTTGGRYYPAIQMNDAAGCSYAKSLDTAILVDTLHVYVSHSPSVTCDSGYVTFTPTDSSVSKLQPTYSWQFIGGGTVIATSTQTSPQFDANATGTFYAVAQATSPTGCTYNATDSVIVQPSYTGSIIGDSDVCYNTPVQYTISPVPTGTTISYLWTFNNGNTDTNEPPAMQTFTGATSGYTHPINVNVTVNGCSSILNKLIWVHALPTINISSDSSHICKSDSLQLTASGGVHYLWSPASYINNDTVSNPKVSSPTTTTYTVAATDQYGCTNSDSIQIQVIQPVTVTVTPDTSFICKNGSVQINAQGANTYLWDTSSYISNINISNPVITPPNSAVFTVNGYSLYNCFVDSTQVYIEVKASPSVSFSSDTLQVMANDQATLQPIYSSDVVSYLWSPSTYLSCTTCANPVSTPTNDIVYKIQVTNQYQCTASDSVAIAVFCAAGKIYIPTAFTPNGDGTNDVFYVAGRGVKQINYFRIFDRFGNQVFARYNCALNDATVGWDGTYGGLRANVGTYVYEVQVQCDSGTVFNYRGTVVLIR